MHNLYKKVGEIENVHNVYSDDTPHIIDLNSGYLFSMMNDDNNIKLIITQLNISTLNVKIKSFKHFYVSISNILCTFATPKLSKNEENISTITQKKSK